MDRSGWLIGDHKAGQISEYERSDWLIENHALKWVKVTYISALVG